MVLLLQTRQQGNALNAGECGCGRSATCVCDVLCAAAATVGCRQQGSTGVLLRSVCVCVCLFEQADTAFGSARGCSVGCVRMCFEKRAVQLLVVFCCIGGDFVGSLRQHGSVLFSEHCRSYTPLHVVAAAVAAAATVVSHIELHVLLVASACSPSGNVRMCQRAFYLPGSSLKWVAQSWTHSRCTHLV
jgi:hypothetical protein